MNGSVFKRCPCTENKPQGKGTRSCKKEHGSWYFVHDLPAAGSRRPQIKRGGYRTKEDAEDALSRSLVRFGQCGIAAERDVASGRQAVAEYLRTWLTGRKGIKTSTRRILDYNPDIHAELEPAEPPRARYWTHEEAGQFLDAITGDPLYHLAVYRGLRRGELIALRWSDLDLDDAIIEIRRNIVQIGSRTEEGTPKSEESQRLIALDGDTVTVLRDHRARQQELTAALGLGWCADGFVFGAADGGALSPDYVSRHLTALIKATGVPRVTLHQLRHSAASLMLEAGADLKYVQHVLGHSSIYITAKLYVHITRRLDLKRSAQVASLIPRKNLLPSGSDPAGRAA